MSISFNGILLLSFFLHIFNTKILFLSLYELVILPCFIAKDFVTLNSNDILIAGFLEDFSFRGSRYFNGAFIFICHSAPTLVLTVDLAGDQV